MHTEINLTLGTKQPGIKKILMTSLKKGKKLVAEFFEHFKAQKSNARIKLPIFKC